MIIGIDASRANSTQRTGTEWYSFFLIREFVRIIPPEHTVILYTKEPLLPDLAQDVPKHFQSRVLSWKFGFLWTQLRLSWEMFWHAPDLLFVPAHTIPFLHPQKTVVTLHDVGFERFADLYNDRPIGEKIPSKKRLLSFFVRLLTLGRYRNNELDYHRFSARFCIKNASHILTVSDFSKEEIQELFHVPSEKITRIYNGFDADWFAESADTKLPEMVEKLPKPYVLFLGRLEQKKNIPVLLEAWSILKKENDFPHTLVLAGAPGFQYDAIQRRIDDLGVRESVHETGYVPAGAVPHLLKHAALFVFPSLYEGFGIPVLEAFASDVSVACSDIPALHEVAGDAASYFDPKNPVDIARVMGIALLTPNPSQRISARNRLARFSWRTTAQQTWAVLSSFLSKDIQK